ncbi:DUF1553 domain-containing protein [Singulisphaera sp. PoT]|uniref:DUF1553 domain-containing protein n=1 Tax=Singulisphaera sp. PoT TaxID=3411797 RepID=UPI003BF59B60
MTTVPQQALFSMNSPLVVEQAKALASRPDVEASAPQDSIRALYRLVLARTPAPDELESAERFLKAPADSEFDPRAQLAQVLLMTNELMFVD